jgi:hypothetical protein
VDNVEELQTNSDAHSRSTRHRNEFRALTAGQSKYKEAVYSAGIMLFSHLPPTIASLDHDRKYLSQH